MNKIFIVGNWKMNPQTSREAIHLLSSIKTRIKNTKKVEVVICPPFVYLAGIGKKKSAKIRLGSQDCFWEEKGAFTGEVSSLMLKDLGCSYVIVGHSERRKYFHESDTMINKKLKSVLGQGLRPILCIDKVSQIKKDIKGIPEKKVKKIILAYEPIWAIGTGKACSFKQAKKFNLSIKRVLGKNHPVLYGGSVSSQNALGYIKEAQFQGLLIGGASLKPKEFVKVIELMA